MFLLLNHDHFTVGDIQAAVGGLAFELAALQVVVSVSAIGLDDVEHRAINACCFVIGKCIGWEVFYRHLIQVACQSLYELHVAALFANGLVVLRLIEGSEGSEISSALVF